MAFKIGDRYREVCNDLVVFDGKVVDVTDEFLVVRDTRGQTWNIETVYPDRFRGKKVFPHSGDTEPDGQS